jgi:hypothetical protein
MNFGRVIRSRDRKRFQHRHYPYWCEGTVSTRGPAQPSPSTPASPISIKPAGIVATRRPLQQEAILSRVLENLLYTLL